MTQLWTRLFRLALCGLLTACSTTAPEPANVIEVRVIPQRVETGSLRRELPLTLERVPVNPDGEAPVKGVIRAGGNAARQYNLCAIDYNSLMGLIAGHNASAILAAAGDQAGVDVTDDSVKAEP